VVRSYSQVVDTGSALPPLKVNSAIRNMTLADSFSTAGDSINASRYYLKIDPYFFVSTNKTNESLEASFADYLLTRQARDEYRKIFAAAYNGERTEAYKTFKAMFAEDQAMRNKHSTCGDSFSCAVLERKVTETDSPHFEYLYNYVKQNGWPTYENGSRFAEIIAMHDGQHMQYYLPHVKRSVIKGNSGSSFYYNLLNRAKPMYIDQLRSHKNKVSFDVSYVLKGNKMSPAQEQEIQNAIQKYGPITFIYFVYESANEKDFKDFINGGYDGTYWIAWHMMVFIQKYQREKTKFGSDKDEGWYFAYSPIEGEQKRLTVFLMY
jgi:hypothetical protein